MGHGQTKGEFGESEWQVPGLIVRYEIANERVRLEPL